MSHQFFGPLVMSIYSIRPSSQKDLTFAFVFVVLRIEPMALSTSIPVMELQSYLLYADVI